MVERAIASHEATPNDADESTYQELRRLHAHLLRNHLPEILGPIYQLIDLKWMPVFKYGRPREMAWRIHSLNLEYLEPSLASHQLKRLRYLYLSIDSNADRILEILSHRIPKSLRSLNIHFNTIPSEAVFHQFWSQYHGTEELGHIQSLKIRMPRLTDAGALLIRKAFNQLEDLSFESRDRQGITPLMCEYLADDVQSNALHRLSLVGTSIGDQGLYALVSSPNMKQLQALDLRDGTLTNTAAKLLTAETDLPKLVSVDLRYNAIDPAGVNMLEKCSFPVNAENQHERPSDDEGQK